MSFRTLIGTPLLIVGLGGLVVGACEAAEAAAPTPTAREAVSAAMAAQPGVDLAIPLTEAQLPKGLTAEERKAQDSARDQHLRESCKQIPKDTFEKYQCERPVQVALIQQLDDLLARVADKQPQWPGVDVAAEQALWVTHRDACRQAQDIKMCLEFAYLERIAQLQAQFALVPVEGPIRYSCEGLEPPLLASFYATNPPLLILQQASQRLETWMRPTSGGVNFEGEGVNFHELKGGAEWTQGDKHYHCSQQP